MSTIRKVNTALQRAGITNKLVRNSAGYYYLTFAEDNTSDFQCSIYCYSLPDDDAGFNYAAGEINRAFEAQGLAAPLELKETGAYYSGKNRLTT